MKISTVFITVRLQLFFKINLGFYDVILFFNDAPQDPDLRMKFIHHT